MTAGCRERKGHVVCPTEARSKGGKGAWYVFVSVPKRPASKSSRFFGFDQTKLKPSHTVKRFVVRRRREGSKVGTGNRREAERLMNPPGCSRCCVAVSTLGRWVGVRPVSCLAFRLLCTPLPTPVVRDPAESRNRPPDLTATYLPFCYIQSSDHDFSCISHAIQTTTVLDETLMPGAEMAYTCIADDCVCSRPVHRPFRNRAESAKP